MPHPFFDVVAFPWHRVEARRLLETLAAAPGLAPRIAFFYQAAGGQRPLSPNLPADLAWKEVFELLALARLVKALCDPAPRRQPAGLDPCGRSRAPRCARPVRGATPLVRRAHLPRSQAAARSAQAPERRLEPVSRPARARTERLGKDLDAAARGRRRPQPGRRVPVPLSWSRRERRGRRRQPVHGSRRARRRSAAARNRGSLVQEGLPEAAGRRPQETDGHVGRRRRSRGSIRKGRASIR